MAGREPFMMAMMMALVFVMTLVFMMALVFVMAFVFMITFVTSMMIVVCRFSWIVIRRRLLWYRVLFYNFWFVSDW